MPNRRLYVHTLERALRVVGSEKALADLLWVTPTMLRRYLGGELTPPDEVFLKAVDIVFNHSWASPLATRSQRANLEATVHVLQDAERAVEAAAATQAEARSLRAASRASALAHRLFDPAYRPTDRLDMLQTGLDAALVAARTDTGDIELADADGVLRMATWRGFADDDLESLDRISAQPSACSLAFAERKQVAVGDVASHPFYIDTSALEALHAANVRAVCATPLVTRGGDTLGVVAIHWHEPKAWQSEELAALELVARGTAGWLSRLPPAP